MTEKPLVNRVANSGLKTINLENYYPANEIVVFDIKHYLFKELILKEKDFRNSLKEHDWTQYENCHVCVVCSTDAIIPLWANMLVSTYLKPIAESIFIGTKKEFLTCWYQKEIASINPDDYQDERVIIKGCSNKPVPPSAYAELTAQLIPQAQSIMFGEPCSTVPVFKRPRNIKK